MVITVGILFWLKAKLAVTFMSGNLTCPYIPEGKYPLIGIDGSFGRNNLCNYHFTNNLLLRIHYYCLRLINNLVVNESLVKRTDKNCFFVCFILFEKLCNEL